MPKGIKGSGPKNSRDDLATEVRSPVHAESNELSEPSNLDAPEPRAGYVQRWIRIDLRGDGRDAMNYSRAMREGWRPRPLTDIPETFHPPVKANGAFTESLVVHDLVLCERPKARDKQAEARRRARTRAQTTAVNNNVLREIPADLRQIERSSTVTRGRMPSRTPVVQD